MKMISQSPQPVSYGIDERVRYRVTVYGRMSGHGALDAVETLEFGSEAVALAEAEAEAKYHPVAIVFKVTTDAAGVRHATVLKVFGTEQGIR